MKYLLDLMTVLPGVNENPKATSEIYRRKVQIFRMNSGADRGFRVGERQPPTQALLVITCENERIGGGPAAPLDSPMTLTIIPTLLLIWFHLFVIGP